MLKILKNTFNELYTNKINYCLFKEFENPEVSFLGEIDDIDILVCKDDFKKFEKIVKKHGFYIANLKIFNDGIFYYIGYDFDTMKYIILHVYTKLRIGNKKYKEYHYKYEHLILKQKKYNKKFCFYYIDQENEFLLLITRLSMKKKIKEDDKNRLKYLLEQLKDKKKYDNTISNILFAKSYKFIINFFVENELNDSLKILNKYFRKNKSKQIIPMLFRIINESKNLIFVYIKHKLKIPKYKIRTFGNLFALQGIDGAGKSTQLDIISGNNFLKLTGIKTIYGGNNQYWWPFLHKRLVFFASKQDLFSKFYKKWLSILTIFDRRLRLVKAYLYIIRGYDVVFDRYFYDDLTSIIKLKLEGKKISLVGKIFRNHIIKKPKITFFLSLTAEEAYKRKQDYSFDKVQLMIKSYNEVFKARKEVLKIDAMQSINDISKIIVSNIVFSTRE